jgi:hypothetical protein
MSKRNLPATVEVIAEPQAFIRGRFSIYETPDGGFHIAAIFDGEDETRHTEIPGAMLKMAGMLGGGNPLSMLRSMFGGK